MTRPDDELGQGLPVVELNLVLTVALSVDVLAVERIGRLRGLLTRDHGRKRDQDQRDDPEQEQPSERHRCMDHTAGAACVKPGLFLWSFCLKSTIDAKANYRTLLTFTGSGF